MKMKIILIFIIGAIGYYIFQSNYNEVSEPKFNKIVKKKALKKSVKNSIINRKNINRVSQSSADMELIKQLQPPDMSQLKYVWTEEYGCFVKKDDSERDCEFDFLNATSLKDALWMRRNGYPSKSMLKLVQDPSYKKEIYELAKNKYPAALAVVSIEAMKLGNYREAAHMALSNIAYSNKAETFPHLLYGEALMKDGKDIAGVTSFYIAALLGDTMANGRAMSNSPDTPFSTVALNSAHNYLRNVFGVNIPKDPRPEGDDGG